jgi:uncharacterized membrane protein
MYYYKHNATFHLIHKILFDINILFNAFEMHLFFYRKNKIKNKNTIQLGLAYTLVYRKSS